jgi:hypothetical protein
LLAAEAFCRTAVSRATGRRPSDADLAADARLGSAIVG